MKDYFIPVILGTVRQGRLSEPVAQFVLEQLQWHSEIETELVDIRAVPFPVADAGPDAKIPELAAIMHRADGYIIVTPEYNHSYPGLLKHVLDLNYKEYVHKSVGICSVSVGPFGGVRAVEALLPSLKAFGLGTIVTDLNFGNVNELFDANGRLTAEAHQTYQRRFERFIAELLWLTKTLKYGREHFSLEAQH